MNSTKKFGSNRHNKARQVVRMRTKDLMSWKQIGNALGVSAPTARKLFQERVGEHQHHDHIPGKAGRWPNEYDTDAEFPYLTGKGDVNEWHRLYGSDLVDA